MYHYQVWVIDSQTTGSVKFITPKLDFRKGDVLAIGGELLQGNTPGFRPDTIYEFEIHKIVWDSIDIDKETSPYYVAELQVVYVDDLGCKEVR